MDKKAWYRRLPVRVDDSPLSYFVILKFRFLVRLPPAVDGYILPGLPGQLITIDAINRALKAFAHHTGLDPSRSLPRSIRVGPSFQTGGMPLNDRMRHTNHKSIGGVTPYFRKSLDLA